MLLRLAESTFDYTAKLECDVFLSLYANPHPRFWGANKLKNMASRLVRIRKRLRVDAD